MGVPLPGGHCKGDGSSLKFTLLYRSVLTFPRLCCRLSSHSDNVLRVAHVWGFEDAPVSQGKLEHAYFLHGENMLSVAFSGGQAHVFKSVATYDHVQ